MEAKDYRLALEVEKDTRKIQGLYVERHQVLSRNIAADKLDDEQLMQIISSN